MVGSCSLLPPPVEQLTEWVEYSNELEHLKRSCNKLTRDWRLFFEQLYSFPTPFTPDHAMHGGGVQGLRPGGYLSPHLDWALHPNGRERRLNLVVFLNHAAGDLDFYDDACNTKVFSVSPAPGRFVAWEPSDTSYHGVSTNDGSVERFTANACFLAEARPGVTRKRSLFIPRR